MSESIERSSSPFIPELDLGRCRCWLYFLHKKNNPGKQATNKAIRAILASVDQVIFYWLILSIGHRLKRYTSNTKSLIEGSEQNLVLERILLEGREDKNLSVSIREALSSLYIFFRAHNDPYAVVLSPAHHNPLNKGDTRMVWVERGLTIPGVSLILWIARECAAVVAACGLEPDNIPEPRSLIVQ